MMTFDHYLEDIVDIALKADFNTTEYLFRKHIGICRTQLISLENDRDNISCDCEERCSRNCASYHRYESFDRKIIELNKTIQCMELLISSNRCKL